MCFILIRIPISLWIGVGNRGEASRIASETQDSERQTDALPFTGKDFVWSSFLQGVELHSPVAGGGGAEGGCQANFSQSHQLHSPKLLSSCSASPKSLAPKPSLFIPHTPDGSCCYSTQGIRGWAVPSLERKTPSGQWHQPPPACCSMRWWETRHHVSSFLCFVFSVLCSMTLWNVSRVLHFNCILLEFSIFTVFKSVGINLHVAVSWFLNNSTIPLV